jgi:hypothetical protein
MDDHSQRLTRSTRNVRAAAERVERDAGAEPDALHAAHALRDVEAALHALSRALYVAGRSIIPPAAIHESISTRYARAAASWPGPTPPSYEQQAHLLTVLHDAGAALHAAAGRTARASDVLGSIASPPGVQRDRPPSRGLDRRHGGARDGEHPEAATAPARQAHLDHIADSGTAERVADR